MAKPPSGSERIKSQFEEQARATAETQKVNSELSHQVTELQDQLRAERESTEERDRKSTRLNSSHITRSRMPSSA